jgi:hypothetical protein
MNKINSTGIGLLLAIMSVSTVAHAVDFKSERYSAEGEFVLYLSSIGYSFNGDDSVRSETDAGQVQDEDWRYAGIQTTFTDWSAAFRLTAGIADAQPRSALTRGPEIGMTTLDKASKTSLVIDSPDADSGASASGSQLGANTGPRLKLAVGVGTTAPEAETGLDDELGGLDQAQQKALLEETDNSASPTVTDLDDYLDRPSLSIGVNYAF